MSEALRVEFLKFRRAKVVWIASGLVVVLVPFLAVSFVWLAEQGGVGALAGKLDGLVVGSGWEAYLGGTGQMMAVGQFLAIGFLSVWCYGREFAEGTVEALFGLKVSRSEIAVAKMVTLIGWSLFVTVALVLSVGTVGALANLEVGSVDLSRWLLRVGLLSIMTSLLASTLGFVASVGRGYLPGLGTLIGVVAASQIAVLFGTGGWFPYAAPGLWAVSWQDPEIIVTGIQLALVPLVALLALGATARWWRGFELA